MRAMMIVVVGAALVVGAVGGACGVAAARAGGGGAGGGTGGALHEERFTESCDPATKYATHAWPGVSAQNLAGVVAVLHNANASDAWSVDVPSFAEVADGAARVSCQSFSAAGGPTSATFVRVVAGP